jgi:hypothetical protein
MTSRETTGIAATDTIEPIAQQRAAAEPVATQRGSEYEGILAEQFPGEAPYSIPSY